MHVSRGLHAAKMPIVTEYGRLSDQLVTVVRCRVCNATDADQCPVHAGMSLRLLGRCNSRTRTSFDSPPLASAFARRDASRSVRECPPLAVGMLPGRAPPPLLPLLPVGGAAGGSSGRPPGLAGATAFIGLTWVGTKRWGPTTAWGPDSMPGATWTPGAKWEGALLAVGPGGPRVVVGLPGRGPFDPARTKAAPAGSCPGRDTCSSCVPSCCCMDAVRAGVDDTSGTTGLRVQTVHGT